MVENKLVIIGNENSVIYYNLNKQFTNLKKIIITGDEILNSYESSQIKELINKLKTIKKNNYKEILEENSYLFDTNLNNEIYKKIQESLKKISEQYMDVQLKDYNFMNSVSNTKFNITLRCENFSITNFYVEKGTFIKNIMNLVKQYLSFEGNLFRLSKLEKFQVEIYESEEIYKSVYLKKENNKLLLASYFGFPNNKPINYQVGNEFYISKDNDFKFYKNKQTDAILKEHTNIVSKEINSQEKILSNEDLILINEKTKNIDDALIECYINSKNHLRIVNVSVIENPIDSYSDNGFIIKKSTNNYDRVSVLTMQDDLEEDTVNPKYLLLKSTNDIKEILSNITILSNVDGIIITKNFYIPYLTKIGELKNIDILYSNKPLNKSLDQKINWENFDIETKEDFGIQEINPFSKILGERNKEKDEMLEKLKNIDLSTPEKNKFNREDDYMIEDTINSIIGSSNSSFNKGKATNYGSSVGSGNGSSGTSSMYSQGSVGSSGVKGALGLLADAAFSQQANNQQRRMQEEEEQKRKMIEEEKRKAMMEESQRQQNTSFSDFTSIPDSDEISEKFPKTMDDFFSGGSMPNVEEAVANATVIKEEVTYPKPERNLEIMEDINLARYEDIVATEVIGAPNLSVDAFYADMNTISQVSGGKIYFLTLNKDEMTNKNLNYVLPIGLNSPDISGCSLLVNNINDYFLIDINQKNVKYFVNVNEINQTIKKEFINEIINKVGPITLICMKKDIELIGEHINKIRGIYVKDVNSNSELEEIKRQMLVFEKNFLINKL